MKKEIFITWASGLGAAVSGGSFFARPNPNLVNLLSMSSDKDVVRGFRQDGSHQDYQLREGRLVEAHVTREGLVAMLEQKHPGHARRTFIERDGFLDWAYLDTLKKEGAACRFYGWGARYSLPDTLAWQDIDDLVNITRRNPLLFREGSRRLLPSPDAFSSALRPE